jgi:squamous cell carcinoma antigen recognized by T-cells 3
MKLFKGREISVGRHTQTVLWVTNYPATYDEGKLRDLFSEFGSVKEVRLPSLAFKTSRRFAYVEFTHSVIIPSILKAYN